MKAVDYIPTIRDYPVIPEDVRQREPVWEDMSTILKDLIKSFNVNPKLALDLGVLFGFSTCALANYFERVIGVDTFRDDRYDNNPERPSNFVHVFRMLKDYPNIQLFEMMYQRYIHDEPFSYYDLIHIDMIHTYIETYNAGWWAVQHSNCVIFHDSEAYPAVFEACHDLAVKFKLGFYNYKPSFGLAILSRR